MAQPRCPMVISPVRRRLARTASRLHCPMAMAAQHRHQMRWRRRRRIGARQMSARHRCPGEPLLLRLPNQKTLQWRLVPSDGLWAAAGRGSSRPGGSMVRRCPHPGHAVYRTPCPSIRPKLRNLRSSSFLDGSPRLGPRSNRRSIHIDAQSRFSLRLLIIRPAKSNFYN